MNQVVALEEILAMIAREEAFLPRFQPGTAQHSLLQNRITALQTVCSLIKGHARPSLDELRFALPRVESLCSKLHKARKKHPAESAAYRRLTPMVHKMQQATAIIRQALAEETEEEGLMKHRTEAACADASTE